MGKPAIFRPQNKPLCSWTHDRTGSFLPHEPHPRGVGPLTVIKPPQFSQQNRSYIKLKYRGLINKAWAGEKRIERKTATMILRLFSPHGHGERKAMRYISKHEADVYLDKEEKTERAEDWREGLDSSAFFKCQAWPALQWSQFPFLHNDVGQSYICFGFLYSSLKVHMQCLSFHKWTAVRKLTIIWNSLFLWKQNQQNKTTGII